MCVLLVSVSQLTDYVQGYKAETYKTVSGTQLTMSSSIILVDQNVNQKFEL